jgi:ABC-type nickel/cobalt efflux system permease component RcnA
MEQTASAGTNVVAVAAGSGSSIISWLCENKQTATYFGCFIVVVAIGVYYLWKLKRDQREQIKQIKASSLKTAQAYVEKKMAKEIAAKTMQQQQQQDQLHNPTLAQQQQQAAMYAQQQQQYAAMLQAQAQAHALAQQQQQQQTQPPAAPATTNEQAELANLVAYLSANPAYAVLLQQQQQQQEQYGTEGDQ